MRTTLINHPKLYVERCTGAEGPRHDPYSYQELHVKTPKGDVVMHEGLAEWIKFNGTRIEPPKWIRNVKGDMCIWEKVERAWRHDQLEQLTGYTEAQLDRWARRLLSRCKKCGGTDFHDECGYPGETFWVCDACHHINGTTFDISAVE